MQTPATLSLWVVMVCHASLTAGVARWGLHMNPWMTGLLVLLALHPLLCMVSMLALMHAAWSAIGMYADPALSIPAVALAYLTYVRVAPPTRSSGLKRAVMPRPEAVRLTTPDGTSIKAARTAA